MVAEETSTDMFGEPTVRKSGTLGSVKITVEQTDLVRALSIVKGSVAPQRGTLPATTAVLIRTGESKISLIANNLSTAMQVEIPAVVEQSGACLIPYKVLSDFVTSLPKVRLSINADDNVAKVVSGSYKASIKSMVAEEFPFTPMGEDGEFSLVVDGGLLRRALAQVVICTADKEARPGLNAVMFRGQEGGGLLLAGADGFRLSLRQIGAEGNPIWNVLVPRDAISGLQEMLVKDEPVTIVIQRGQEPGDSPTQFSTLVVLSPRCKFLSRLLSAPYPAFERLIPTTYALRLVCPTAEIRQAIDSVRPFAGGIQNIPIVLQIGDGSIAFSSENVEAGASMVELPIEGEGGTGRALLDPVYIAEILSVIDTEKVNVGYNAENKPISIMPMAGDPLVPDSAHLMLLMPRSNKPQ
jgi:DNA polymerase-3 subunit beta